MRIRSWMRGPVRRSWMADARLHAFLAPDAPFVVMEVRERDFERVDLERRQGAERHQRDRGHRHGEATRRFPERDHEQECAGQRHRGQRQQRARAPEPRDQHEARSSRTKDGAAHVHRVEDAGQLRRAPVVGGGTGPHAEADRERHAEQQRGREDREQARHEQRRQVRQHRRAGQRRTQPVHRVHGETEALKRRQREHGDAELDSGEPRDEVASAFQDRRGDVAAERDAGEHRAEHQRERVRRRPQEDDEHTEPQHLERQ